MARTAMGTGGARPGNELGRDAARVGGGCPSPSEPAAYRPRTGGGYSAANDLATGSWHLGMLGCARRAVQVAPAAARAPSTMAHLGQSSGGWQGPLCLFLSLFSCLFVCLVVAAFVCALRRGRPRGCVVVQSARHGARRAAAPCFSSVYFQPRPPCWAHPLTRYAVGMGLGAGSQGMVGVASHPARCRVETTEHGHHRRPRHRRGLAFHYGTGPCRKTCGRRAIGGTRGGGGEVAALILLSSCSRRSRGHMHMIAQSEPQKGNRQTQQSRPRHICNITRPTVPKPVPVSRRPLASSPSTPPTLRLSPPFAARHA